MLKVISLHLLRVGASQLGHELPAETAARR